MVLYKIYHHKDLLYTKVLLSFHPSSNYFYSYLFSSLPSSNILYVAIKASTRFDLAIMNSVYLSDDTPTIVFILNFASTESQILLKISTVSSSISLFIIILQINEF